MKNILKLLFTLFITIVLFSCAHSTKKPNIILVITDDQGYGDISAHGSPDVLTPNMDKLKSQGISLEDFQVSPTCAPTRSAIMSGKHPFKCGITHTILERERMALGITTLPEVLKRGGYTSGIFGKWHLGDEEQYQPDKRGFDEVFIHGGGGIGQAYPGSCADVPANKYFDPFFRHNGTFVKTQGFCTDVIFKQALYWIKEKVDGQEQFFAYVATNAPHSPFIAPEKYKKKFIEDGYPEKSQGFYGMIENIDDNLGILMEKLEAWGIEDNTVLIFMSDNGKAIRYGSYNAGMKGYKGSVNEGGTRVPFFIRWPMKFEAGKQIDVLQNHYDLMPTLADIAQVDISGLPDIEGGSFLPYLSGESKENIDRYRFVHGGRWPLNPQNYSGQEGGEHWIGTLEESNPENSKYKNCAVRNERYRFINNSKLYDLYNDLGETTDVAAENPEVVKHMKVAYEKWWTNVQPYLVNENVPLPNEKPYWVAFENQTKTKGITTLNILSNHTKKYTILGLGDSITEGGDSFKTYLYPLFKMLSEAGYVTEFIGPNNNKCEIGVIKNAGFGGKNVEYLDSKIDSIYKKYPAAIVLLHAGHNHFFNEDPVDKMIAAHKSIIKKIMVLNPEVKILVAQVITSGKLPKYSYIPEFNKELAAMVAQLKTEEHGVVLVNQAEGFNWEKHCIGDKVHPNSEGAKKMAETWFINLDMLLDKPL
jgi:arylsulfatase